MSGSYCTNRSLQLVFSYLCIGTLFYLSVTYQLRIPTWNRQKTPPLSPNTAESSRSNTTESSRSNTTESSRTNTTEPTRKSDKGIPRIIHQIWNNDVIPAVFHENIRGLVAHNKPPDWTYFFWTINTGTKFIQKEYPRLVYRYTRASNLLKADILRLAVLHHFGGVYFDLDTVSVKPLDPYVVTHNCSFVTDPVEHVFETDKPKPRLLITNSAMLCQPANWFIAEVIEKLSNQSPSCNDAVSCTGPRYISDYYQQIQGTNRSKNLPTIVDYRYFEDKVDQSKYKLMNKACVEPLTKLRYQWTRDVCIQWIERGRERRNISDMAYTYHTWFHTYMYPRKLKDGKERKISDIVKNVTFYSPGA